MESVTISPLEAVYVGARGCNFGLRTRLREDFLIVKRKKGSVCGNHLHKGKISQKNPEVIIHLSGEVRFEWKDMDGTAHSKLLDSPSKIEIQPKTWHRLTAISDILFMEEGLLTSDQYEDDTEKC